MQHYQQIPSTKVVHTITLTNNDLKLCLLNGLRQKVPDLPWMGEFYPRITFLKDAAGAMRAEVMWNGEKKEGDRSGLVRL